MRRWQRQALSPQLVEGLYERRIDEDRLATEIDCPHAAMPCFPRLLMQGVKSLPRGEWHIYTTAIGIAAGESSRKSTTSVRHGESLWNVQEAAALAQIRLSDEGEIPHSLHAWTKCCRVYVDCLGHAIKHRLRCAQDGGTLGAAQVSYPLHAPQHLALLLIQDNPQATTARVIQSVDGLDVVQGKECL